MLLTIFEFDQICPQFYQFLPNINFCHKNALFRTPEAILEIDPNVDMFKLNDESIIKRISQLPTIEGGPARAFIMLSSDKVLKNILLSSTKGVMDATFKVQHKLCCLYNKC